MARPTSSSSKINNLTGRCRITEEEDLSAESNKALRAISVPSKKTRVDNSRSNYNKTGLALPPIAKSNPKDAVVIKNGNFNIGGI